MTELIKSDENVSGDKPLEITTFYPPLVKTIEPRHQRVAGYRVARRSVRSNRRLALVLFLATCVSVFAAGLLPGKGVTALFGRGRADPPLPPISEMLANGATYFAAVMTILIAHEMGHYLQARRYGVPATVPYFIPFPITPFGTMGAVIVQGAGMADRKSLFDIAISGPLAGLVFALPITAIGIHQAVIHQGQEPPGEVQYAMPLILQWMVEFIRGPMGPHSWMDDNPWLFAGWVGIFITALNLMPIGQLDGGHILYTLIGRRAHLVAIGLLALGATFMILNRSPAYLLMMLLLFVTGARHPPTADDTVPLGPGRIILGWLTLAFLIIGFSPIPIRMTEQQDAPPPATSEEIQVHSSRPRAFNTAGKTPTRRHWERRA